MFIPVVVKCVTRFELETVDFFQLLGSSMDRLSEVFTKACGEDLGPVTCPVLLNFGQVLA